MEESAFKIVTLTISILATTFDLICDWLLYYEVNGVEQGLVFGPFLDATLSFLVLFCCIGTVIYIVELILKLLDFFIPNNKRIPTWLLYLVNLTSVWIEDIPLIMLSVYIAGCRDNAITILLLTKALSTFLEVFTNVGIEVATHYHYKSKEQDSNLTGRKKWLKIPFRVGLTVMLVCSVLVFGLTQYFSDSKNVVRLSSPKGFNEGRYNIQKYLDGAGVFMNFDVGQMDAVPMETNEWIKLIDLMDITNSQSKSSVVSVTYDSNPNTRLLVQWTTSGDSLSPDRSVCYSTHPSLMSQVTTCSNHLPLTSDVTSVNFKFVYETPSSTKPLGDIFYNYRLASYTDAGSCTCTVRSPSFSLRYFKVTPDTDHTNPLVTLTGNSREYYKADSILLAVSEVWRTGHFGCRPTGRSIPRQNTSIRVPCLTWGLTGSVNSTSSLLKDVTSMSPSQHDVTSTSSSLGKTTANNNAETTGEGSEIVDGTEETENENTTGNNLE